MILYRRIILRMRNTKIYRTIILPVVLYGCEAWSLTAREERKLRVFKNMVLRRIRGLLEKYPTFGREKETGLLGALDN